MRPRRRVFGAARNLEDSGSLTIMATIFIPLTFIAGIYGMNFEYMPELKWHWAYPALWVIFISIFLGMLAWFKYKKWL